MPMFNFGIKDVVYKHTVYFACGCVYHHSGNEDDGYRGHTDKTKSWWWMRNHVGAINVRTK